MLNLFPELLAYGFMLGPLVLRVSLAVYTLRVARRNFTLARSASGADRMYLHGHAVVGSATGILLFVGLYTQLAALVCLVAYSSFALRKAAGRSAYLLAAAISLSLLFLGAGAFAFDLSL